MSISVFLVEDHAVFRAGVRSLVDAEPGIVVVGEAATGQSAISQVERLMPDVVVLDIGLPDIHGIDIARRIKQGFPGSAILAFSIHGEKQTVEDMLRAGASGYLLKESAPEELLAAIRAVAGGERFLSVAIKDVLLSQYMQIDANSGPSGDDAESKAETGDVILDTKLHRPRVSSRSVQRSHLWTELDQGLNRPLTLVSAPAGYGKSTLVSQWLEQCAMPNAWVSLDERDSDLRSFLTYFTRAIQRHFSDALQQSAILLNAGKLPPLNVLTATLLNDLARIRDHHVIVLDDYHRINEPAIHQMLRELLRRPPQTLHLVLITRVDPGLDLAQMRAYRRVGEIRAEVLRFSVEETADFLGKAVGDAVEEAIVADLTVRTEGWVTGLHLATLSARSSADLASSSTSLPGEQQTLDYLVAETLARQPQELQAWLLKTSILDRLCAPLCEAVCVQADVQTDVRADVQAESSIRGDGFVTWLNERNLFVISLDHRRHWYRYHHLFQNLLQGRLEHALSPDEIAHLHTRASHWFLAQGLLDEAFEHALKGGDIETAVKIVVDHRHAEHDADRWHVVERWLDQLPGDVKAQHPALLLAQAWTDYQRFQMERIPAFVEQAGALLNDHFPDPTVLGDLNYFRGNLQYWQAEGEGSVRSLEAALVQVAGRQRQVEYNVELSLALARTMTGQKETALEALDDRIRTAGAINGQFLTHLLGGLAIVRLICGELPQARVQAQRLHAESTRRNLTNNMAWSLYLHGVTLLHTFDLEQALEYFAAAIEHRYSMMRGGAIDALAAMALTQQMLRREADAAESVGWLLELAHATDGPHALAVARSCQARLALLRGDMDAAMLWASSASETAAPPTLFLWAEIPVITLARVHIAAGTEQSLKEASQLLAAVRRQSEESHFTCQTIEIAVLQAIALERQGRTAEALIVAEDALAMAAPGGWIRPFVEAGKPMAGLLNQLRSQPVAPDLAIQLVRILSADPAQVMSAGQSRVVEPLTGRELQVLRLLSTDLSVIEIAAQLDLTVATVRSHSRRIYAKLEVHGRHEAAGQARRLELI